jgi:hypothetical protein
MRFRGRPTGVFLRPCYTYTPSDFYAKFEKDPLLFNLPPLFVAIREDAH